MPSPGLTIDKVVDAALDLMREEGDKALSMSALARRLGVKPPSLYNHVKGVDDLKRAMRLSGLRTLHQHLQAAVVGWSGPDALWAAGQAYRTFAREHPALYSLTLAATEEADEELQAAGQQLLTTLMAMLRGYRLEGDAALHAIRCLRSALHGFVSLEIGGGFAMPLDLDESFDRLLRMLDQSFRAEGSN